MSTTTEQYSYDAVGNRLTSFANIGNSGLVNYTYDVSNHMLTRGTNSFTYDANGSQLTKTTTAGTQSYTWDYENRLSQVVTTVYGTVTFKYDPFGRRIIKSGADPGVPLYYHYDGDSIVDYYSQAGVLQYYFINGPGTDETLFQGGGSSNWNFLTDGLGSNTSASTTAGMLQYTFTYDSFGRTLQSTTIRPRYTGQVRDWESDITYYKARYYDPTIGRFLSEDPIRWSGGQPNFYVYVRNNAVNYRDPLGLKIVVLGSDGDYQQAINYLKADSGMAAIIHDLESSSTIYTVTYNNEDDDSYDPFTHTIHWDPHSALRCTRGGRQTPALGLGHEMAHADRPWYWTLIGWIPWPDYDNLEERRVILGAETSAAHKLGEGTRTDHSGTPYPVATPTSR